MTFFNLEVLDLALCRGRPLAYGRVRARAPRSDAREREVRAVDAVVADRQPPVLLAVSQSHDELAIELVGARIEVFATGLPYRRSVLTDAGADGRVAVRLRPIVGAEGDAGRRFALVGQTVRRVVAAGRARICCKLRGRQQDDLKSRRT